ncbi:MAG TPA: hypothetical protein VJ723_07025 [Candidatus Angelobacter sp.]|nr:hypothetical protein [Candidatus Angelobacter sp.]
MKRRIGLWALGGFVVACCWVLYGMAAGPNENLGRSTIAAITAPASLFGRSFPIAFYWPILLNAAIYALFGLAVELLRRHLRSTVSN